MKKLLRQAAFVACGWMITAQAFADEGIKTVVQGSVSGVAVKKIYLHKREQMVRVSLSDSVENGQFQLALNLKEPAFFMVGTGTRELPGFYVYLNPGDNLIMKVENGRFVMSGKGSGINQLLYDLNKNFPYLSNGDVTGVYKSRVNAINQSTNEEVVRNKALLQGNAQGEYLDRVYGSLINEKVFGATDDVKVVNFTDLNIPLLPEIEVYENWRQTIQELMYSKMKAGQLKIRNMNTWVADFGIAIENQKLREDFMVASIEFAVLLGDFTSINAVIKETLPLIKDPKNVAKINALQPKIAAGLSRYKDVMPGTDMSAFTFYDVNGKQVAISDYKGKFIFIDIWNTGCHPCIAEIPYIKKMEHELKGKDIVFVSISCDTEADVWKKFLEKRNLLETPQLLMSGGFKDPFFEKIQKSGIPRFVIIDKEGKMVDYNSCKRPSNPLLNIYLTELLNKS